MNEQFNGAMLALARRLRKVSQTEVVARLKGKVTQGTLSKVEHGRIQPDDGLIDALADAVEVKRTFLCNASYLRMAPVSFHRKRQKLGVTDLEAIHSKSEVYRLNLKRLLESVELEPTLPIVPAIDPDTYDGNIGMVAAAIRQRWMLPRGPVGSLTRLLEGAGVIVVSFDFGTRLIDGFCQHAGDGLPAIIFMNSGQPTDRFRFSLAHELGHLVMHQTPNPTQEVQANRFASELLMPTVEIKPQFLGRLTIQKLMDLKLHWGVSMQALIYKAWETGAISDRQKKYHFIELSRRGFRDSEPIEVNIPETPGTLREVLAAHLNELGFSVADLSDLFGLSEDEIRRWYPMPKDRPRLQLVV